MKSDRFHANGYLKLYTNYLVSYRECSHTKRSRHSKVAQPRTPHTHELFPRPYTVHHPGPSRPPSTAPRTPYNGLRPAPLSFPPGHKNPLPAMAKARILVKMENGLRVNYPRRQDSLQYREMGKIMQPGSQYLVGIVRFFRVPEESRPVSPGCRAVIGRDSSGKKSFLKKMLFANDTSRPPGP